MSFRDFVERLEAKFDVKRWLDQFSPKRVDENWIVECPDCEKSKLYVLVEPTPDRKPGTWICFRCDDSGGAFDLVRLLADVDLFGALKILQEFSEELEVAQDLRAAVDKALAGSVEVAPSPPPEPIPLPEGFVSAADSRRLPTYFGERGISRPDALRHKLGWCEGGYYRNRLVVPVFRRGVLSWWLARWMNKVPPYGVKKYLNSPGAASSLDLFGWAQAKGCRRVVLVEDVFSVIKQGKGSLATFGTHFSREQFRLLADLDPDEVVVAWDFDALEKSYALADALSGLWSVRVAVLDARDPDEYARDEFRSLVEASPILGGRDIFRKSVEARLTAL